MVKSGSMALAALVIAFLAGIVAYTQFVDLKSRLDLAETDLRQAQADVRASMDEKDFGRIGQARKQFSEAHEQFALINSRINVLSPLIAVAERLPWIGPQAQAASRLMRAGPDMAEAGEEACLAAEKLIEAAIKSDGENITQGVFAATPAATAHLARSLAAIDRVEEEYRSISAIPKDSLHPSLARVVRELDVQVPKQRALLLSSLDLMHALPRILGDDGEKTYLVLVQDSGELRPTGGFIGNYGIIRFRDGKKVETIFNDVYQLDWPYYHAGKSSPPVAMFARYLPQSTFWALRDSNIWPDFERSAKQAAWFAVQEGAAERIDGVIGITHDIVEPVMKAIGPIDIPEYGETVEGSNALEKIRYYQTTGPSAAQRTNIGVEAASNRKLFTSLVLKAVIDRLETMDIESLVNLANYMRESISTKAIQVYFDDPELQEFAETYGIAGAMKESTGDYLWAIDMNLSAAKDNLYVRQSMSYTVSIDPTGAATGELALTYDYSSPGKLYTGTFTIPYYANYLRVYVPVGSKLVGEQGNDEPVETFNEVGRTVFGTFVKVPPRKVKEVRLRYSLPSNVWRPGDQTTYELMVQKQAGKKIQSFEATLELPPGLSISGSSPGSYTIDGHRLSYRGDLGSDTFLSAEIGTE